MKTTGSTLPKNKKTGANVGLKCSFRHFPATKILELWWIGDILTGHGFFLKDKQTTCPKGSEAHHGIISGPVFLKQDFIYLPWNSHHWKCSCFRTHFQDKRSLAKLFARIDTDGSGQLTIDELIEGAQRDADLQSRLRVMDIDESLWMPLVLWVFRFWWNRSFLQVEVFRGEKNRERLTCWHKMSAISDDQVSKEGWKWFRTCTKNWTTIGCRPQRKTS